VRRSVFQAAAALLLPAMATAAEQQPSYAASHAGQTSAVPGAASLAQVTLSLVLVLAAIFAAAWVVRRLRNFGKLGPGAIEILADVAVGAKERAVLVQVGRQQLLLGVAPGRVNTLHVLTEPVTTAPAGPPASSDGADPAAPPDFKAILKRSLGL
jgi:flagellar protein FliO/FliZ